MAVLVLGRNVVVSLLGLLGRLPQLRNLGRLVRHAPAEGSRGCLQLRPGGSQLRSLAEILYGTLPQPLSGGLKIKPSRASETGEKIRRKGVSGSR
jgi:hypothetical protein